MRLIDLDAFREEFDLREHCEDCGRRNKKECDYPLYSARDFCGWLDDVPTIEAVPLDKLCDWLARNAVNFADGNDRDPEAWEITIKECVMEGTNADKT